MKKIKLTLLVILLSSCINANETKCMEYDSSKFTLIKDDYSTKKLKTTKYKIDSLKVYFFKNRSGIKPITLEYTVNGHKRYYKYIFCTKEDNKEWCGIECDGGGFYANKNLEINIQNAINVYGEPESSDEISLSIVPKIKNKYIKGKEFICPQNLPVANDLLDEKYYKDNPKGRYVCYKYKDNGKYEGCFRSTKKCKELHIQHFGKYATKDATKKALLRCKRSKPNQDYVDNKNGLYVCYDYIDDSGEYSGCFRAKKSCKRLNKKHFGHYPNIIESQKALRRCMASIPRK